MKAKKLFKGAIITGMLVNLISIGGYYDTHYTKKDCKVIATAGNTVIIEDPQGHIWHYEGTGFSQNETLTLKMHTNYTDNFIDDDVIETIKKSS